MKIRDILLALLVIAIWGFNPAVAKLGMLDIPPFALLSIRYLLTAIIFMPFAKVKRSELKMLFVVALFANVINNGLLYVAYQYLQPAASTLLTQTETPVTILMACLFAREKISLRQVLSIIIALCGVVVILGVPEISLYGASLILLSRVFWGVCQLMFKDSKELKASAYIAYSSLFAIPFVAILSVFCEPEAATMIIKSFGIGFVLIMIFQVFALSLANVLWQKLIAWNDINKVSPFVMLEIVFSLLSGFVLFGDGISGRMLLGMIMVTSGVWFTIKPFKPLTNQE